jgi:hypothetical protein
VLGHCMKSYCTKLAVVVSTLLISGCVSFSGLDPPSNYSNFGEESVIVLGISPRFRVHIFDGEKTGDKWIRDVIIVKLNVFPEDGYIVAKVPPKSGTQNYGIGGLLPEGLGLSPRMFSPCQGQSTLTFDAPAGKVVYVGDIRFVDKGSSVMFESSYDMEAARAHMRKHFPLLADKLTPGIVESRVLANVQCGGSPIPIFIPRR